MARIVTFDSWTIFLRLFFLVLFFLFITYQDSELLAQQCMEPDMVPICGAAGRPDNEVFCNKSCDESAFCCPLTMDVNCNASYNDLCNFTECKGDNEGAICQVQACDDTREVRECSDEEMTREPCSGCSRGAFCCPLLSEAPVGACSDTYNGVCQGNCKGINQESICRVPEVPARRDNRNVTFVNHCGETIWVGGSNKGLVGGTDTPITGEITGFELPMHTLCSEDTTCTAINPEYRCDTDKGFCVDMKGNNISIHTISVPGNLDSANFWPRTACSFPCTSLPCCKTGDCASAEHGFGIQCNGGTKGPPANSFEVTFNFSDAAKSPNDFYDLTNVDGWVVGIAVEQSGGVELWTNPTKRDPNTNPPGKEVPAPELNCGEPSCKTFNMSKCPAELKERISETNRDVCWSIGLAAANKAQRDRDTTGILDGIAGDCNKLALHGCSCAATDTSGMSCGDDGPGGCALGSSLFCCSPFNDSLPAGHGGICCEDQNDPLYIKLPDGGNPCKGKEWDKPTAWCMSQGIPPGSSECSYAKVFSQQCPQAYSWQFNDQESTFQCINPDYKITFCPGTTLTDHDEDGLPANRDIDSDNDGVTDEFEASYNNEDLVTTSTSRDLVDPNLYEGDGDGIQHQFDLDSDGDGIPDHYECGGENDSDRDGMSDNYVDSDGDGLHDEHDEDQVGNVLECPDTDSDGIPDFLDTDSDNDEVTDANETIGGMDQDEDGIHDDSEDLNADGLADSVHPDTGEPLTLLDSDGDGIPNHLDANDNTGGGGCSIVAAGVETSMPVYLLIPLFIVIRRAWRKV